MPNRARPPRNVRFLPGADDAPVENEKPCVVPRVPKSLTEGARPHWRWLVRTMIEARTWQPQFTPTVAIVAELLAEFHENPVEFPGTKLTQSRLLLNDLGLTPASAFRVEKA